MTAPRHYRDYQRENKRMPVAVALGCDPAITYAATAPVPPEVDEMVFAGFLRKKNVEMVACKTIDMEVPADAEIVLEGYVDPKETRIEGPFGDHTGLFTGRLLSGIPYYLHYAAQRTDLSHHDCWQTTQWKIAIWGRPQNGFSCRF